MIQLNLNDYISYLEQQVANHSIYVWAAQGQGYNVISDAWIRKMETSEVNANRAIKNWHKQVDAGYGKVLKAFDCSGLGMYYLMMKMAIIDMTADRMYKDLCDPITKAQLRRGDWVFKQDSTGKKTHVGYIVDDTLRVIEAQGRDAGVVKRALSANKWNCYGRPKMFKMDIEAVWVVTRVLRRGCQGEDVKELQRRLIERGYSCGSAGTDGKFGGATEKAVIAFQKATWPKDKSEWDGIAGRKTLTALGAVCRW